MKLKSVCLRLASVLVASFVPCPSMFIASTRPHTCISSGCQGYRLVLRRLHVASYTYGYGMRWRHESAVTVSRSRHESAVTVTRSHGIRRLRHIHVTKVNTREELVARIVNSAALIKQERYDVLRGAAPTIARRVEKCIEVDGGIFEHLLWTVAIYWDHLHNP